MTSFHLPFTGEAFDFVEDVRYVSGWRQTIDVYVWYDFSKWTVCGQYMVFLVSRERYRFPPQANSLNTKIMVIGTSAAI